MSATLPSPTNYSIIVPYSIKDIIHLKGAEHYTKFFLRNHKTVTYCGDLSFYENELSLAHLFRTHKSHLINESHINLKQLFIKGSILMSDKSRVQVSHQYQYDLITFLTAA